MTSVHAPAHEQDGKVPVATPDDGRVRNGWTSGRVRPLYWKMEKKNKKLLGDIGPSVASERLRPKMFKFPSLMERLSLKEIF